jgi:hypothetical protein
VLGRECLGCDLFGLRHGNPRIVMAATSHTITGPATPG